ncbi:MAG: hypothetical protein AUJ92_11890 [Armatimonadetes bacterium CG2_30_59_28]|nr:YARHG domain-containing protein [Armatimonadota bacterium]OIO93672.1 MAG: hypothetical protein AUJ92_11890 [Armatimonadetes bacterium CG2_30_59_28]PIU64072.1 MAG: hypothetical protein COS85_13820 [Armatimonadetes bacterium CG07_land_8_20_14_0_80_59_28]PIX42138.1 MAG: hypothetical protein COZ56_10060 [Armatimonadetes bacterium CG_4_8_14_3_um_filter_58_9]PIY43021.1 MAG: hypothetical protein COZ05_12370 [Armatimonadetes bacterium CG_4_10_14_3_um_filter_59_10]PJB63609.1 MAG: hypothetical protei
MNCPKCGGENTDAARFCTHCGDSIDGPATCPKCGGENQQSARFCVACGNSLKPQTPHPPPPPRLARAALLIVGIGIAVFVVYRFRSSDPEQTVRAFFNACILHNREEALSLCDKTVNWESLYSRDEFVTEFFEENDAVALSGMQSSLGHAGRTTAEVLLYNRGEKPSVSVTLRKQRGSWRIAGIVPIENPAEQCMSNLKQVAMGIVMYSQDYDERIVCFDSSGGWTKAIYPYTKSDQILLCPSAPEMDVCGYVMNLNVSGVRQGDIADIAGTALLWDGTLNAVNGASKCGDVARRHEGGFNVAFTDGHVKWLSSTNAGFDCGNTPPPPPSTPEGGYLCQECSNRELTTSDLQGKDCHRLRLMRNEMYARHGRPFRDPDLQRYFDRQSWYHRDGNYSDSRLSALEKRNAAFIRSEETSRGCD